MTTMEIGRPEIGRPEIRRPVADFQSVRSRLLGIAYRRLGRVADAEDVVQDVWLRWHGVDHRRVADPVAFLVTVTTRVALNTATSARVRHEVSASGWPAQPDPAAVDPVRRAEQADSLRAAVQHLLERLSPVERAVYLLREAFDYPFREIARVLGLGEANTRQLACRARRHLAADRRETVDRAERDELLDAFLDASRHGDLAPLIAVLARGCVIARAA
jgi:RNA polymerase sigma-70 factor, ECF subfamily